jgi:hypothetical protein
VRLRPRGSIGRVCRAVCTCCCSTSLLLCSPLPGPCAIVMSRSNSVERDSKPLPPVPQPTTQSLVESTNTSITERLAQTLKKMSQDIPTAQYRSPLNLAGRVKHEVCGSLYVMMSCVKPSPCVFRVVIGYVSRDCCSPSRSFYTSPPL